MATLFYSEKEELLFVVGGYLDSTSNVSKFTERLVEHAINLAKHACVSVEEVNTVYIEKSSSYKHMRAFYCKTVHVPEEALRLESTSNWTMMSFLKN